MARRRMRTPALLLALGNAAALSALSGSTTFGNPFSGPAGFADVPGGDWRAFKETATPRSRLPPDAKEILWQYISGDKGADT